MSALRLALTLSLSTLALGSHQAWACTPPAPGATRTVQPAKGATQVPRNTEVRVRYTPSNDQGFAASLPAPTLLDGTGTQVEVEVETRQDTKGIVWILRPKATLAASATYTIQDHFGVTGDGVTCLGSPCKPGLVTAGTFTTGAMADEKSPQFSGLTGFESLWQSCGDSACCGPYAGYKVLLKWQAPSDDSGVEDLRYNVYRLQGGAKERLVSFATQAIGATAGGYLAWAGNLGVLTDGLYEVCAIDLAGHEACGNGPQAFVAPAPPPPEPGPDAGSDTGDASDGDADDGQGADTAGETVGSDAGPDVPVPPDVGGDGAGDTAAQSDSAGQSDTTGVGDADAGTAGDAAVLDAPDAADAVAKPPVSTPKADSGCRAAPAAQPGAGLLLLGAAVWMAWRRRWA